MTSVSFGIEAADAGPDLTQPVIVRLHRQTSGTFPGGTRTQIASTTVNVADQFRTVMNVPLAATVPAGTTELIMEVFTPDGQAPVNHSFFIGSNAAAADRPELYQRSCLRNHDADQCFDHWFPGACTSCLTSMATVLTPTPGTLGNISTRLQVGTGARVMIAGFIVQGSAPKRVLIRAAGPSLTQFGVPNALANPRLELHDTS